MKRLNVRTVFRSTPCLPCGVYKMRACRLLLAETAAHGETRVVTHGQGDITRNGEKALGGT